MTSTGCPHCGAPPSSGGLSGLCPRCLADVAFGAAASAASSGPPDYDFIRELGRGGMGVVYEALQRGVNRRVAIKMLPGDWRGDPEFRTRFRAEAEAIARLRHPNIVALYGTGERDGCPYFSMELVEGPTLAELCREHPLAPERAARYVRQAARAIAHAHARGILHRDLKPSNILVDGDDQPRVTDFGLAKRIDSDLELTRTGQMIGSPGYLPPEQVRGQPFSPSGDVYALGAILYQLLTTRPPFIAETVAGTLRQVVETEPAAVRLLNPRVPQNLEIICLKCLHKEPSRRYAGAAELADDLERFESGQPIRARRISVAERLVLGCRRKPALAAVSVALMMAIVTGVAGIFGQWRRAEDSRETMRLNLYAADLASASVALQDGNLGRARTLLLSHADPRSAIVGATGIPGLPEFAWRLLWDRCRSNERATLGSHPWIVTCVAVSPDGRWAASGSLEEPGNARDTLRCWSLSDALSARTRGGGATVSPGATGAIWSVAFTPDSRTLISSGAQGLRFWDVASGAERTEFPTLQAQEISLAGRTLVGSPSGPFLDGTPPGELFWLDLDSRELRGLGVRGRHPALSPDGRRVAFLDEWQCLRIHDLDSGAISFSGATNDPVFRLRFSPDGSRLAGAGQGAMVRLWEPDRQDTEPRRLEAAHAVWDVAFSPDGAVLLVATSHQQIELWDTAGGGRRGTLSGHGNEVWAVAPSPDGRTLVSGGKDRSVRWWDLRPPLPAPAVSSWRYARPAFSPDGRWLATYAQTNWKGAATVWSMDGAVPPGGEPFRREATMGGFPRGFSPDGNALLHMNAERPALEWRPFLPGVDARTVELQGAPKGLFPAEMLIPGDSRSVSCPDETGEFWRWSTGDGRLLGRWNEAGLGEVFRAALAGGARPGRILRGAGISGNGRWLALGAFSQPAALLGDLETGHTVQLRGHRDDVAAFAFSPDDRILATGSVDGTVRLWAVPSGDSLGELPGHMETVEAVAFSPDGRTLASVNPGIEVTFWHRPTGRELARIPCPGAGHHLVFSPDGTRLAVSLLDDRVEIWNAPVP